MWLLLYITCVTLLGLWCFKSITSIGDQLLAVCHFAVIIWLSPTFSFSPFACLFLGLCLQCFQCVWKSVYILFESVAHQQWFLILLFITVVQFLLTQHSHVMSTWFLTKCALWWAKTQGFWSFQPHLVVFLSKWSLLRCLGDGSVVSGSVPTWTRKWSKLHTHCRLSDDDNHLHDNRTNSVRWGRPWDATGSSRKASELDIMVLCISSGIHLKPEMASRSLLKCWTTVWYVTVV